MIRPLMLPLVLLALAVPTPRLAGQEPASAAALRGVWIPLTDCDVLQTPQATAAGIARLAALGANVVFPVVWTRGHPLYPSHRFAVASPPEAGGETAILPGFEGRDPLRDVVVEAHLHGLEVVPWFEYGFAGGHRYAPGVLHDSHPDWALRDVDGQAFEKNGFRWLDGLHPEVQDLLADCLLEVCAEYDVDGVQGDDRLPALPAEARPSSGSAELLAGLRGPALLSRRARLLSDWLATVRTRVRAIDERLVISLSPSIHDFGLRQYTQDGPAWCRRGLGDWFHPQTYRKDAAATRAVVAGVVRNYPVRGDQLLTSGLLVRVGSYVSSPELLRTGIDASREVGLDGEVLFHAQALLDRDAGLFRVLRNNAWLDRPAVPRRDADWQPRGHEPKAGRDRRDHVWQLAQPDGRPCRIYLLHEGGRARRVTLERGDGDDTATLLPSDRVGWQLLGRLPARDASSAPATLRSPARGAPPRVAVLVDRR